MRLFPFIRREKERGVEFVVTHSLFSLSLHIPCALPVRLCSVSVYRTSVCLRGRQLFALSLCSRLEQPSFISQ